MLRTILKAKRLLECACFRRWTRRWTNSSRSWGSQGSKQFGSISLPEWVRSFRIHGILLEMATLSTTRENTQPTASPPWATISSAPRCNLLPRWSKKLMLLWNNGASTNCRRRRFRAVRIRSFGKAFPNRRNQPCREELVQFVLPMVKCPWNCAGRDESALQQLGPVGSNDGVAGDEVRRRLSKVTRL